MEPELPDLLEVADPTLVDLQPSGSKRWMACTASPGFLLKNRNKLPADKDTKYSKEGTLAHDLAAKCLLFGYDETLFEDPDMAVHVKGYVNLIEGWRSVPNSELVVESAVPLFYSPTKRTGTRDARVIELVGNYVKALRIGDLKYGAGVSVQAKRNTQLSIYAMSSVAELEEAGYELDDKTLVTLMIYQPRVIGEQPVRLWNITLQDLKEFCLEIEWTANMIDDDPHSPALVFAPSDSTCQFCEGVGICSARAGQLLSGLEVGAEVSVATESPLVLPDPQLLPLEHLSKIVAAAPEFTKWLEKCQAFGAALLHEGKDFPGFKLVEGRGPNRTWTNETEARKIAVAYLGEHAVVPSKLRTPAQIEELLKSDPFIPADVKEQIAAYVVKPKGGAVMVPYNDKRPAFAANPAADFVNLDEDPACLR